MRAGGLCGIALCQGNGSRREIRASGKRALVSNCYIICLNCEGPLATLPVIGSRVEEKLFGAVCCRCFLSFEAILKMDLRASLGFLTSKEVPRHICYSDFCWHV